MASAPAVRGGLRVLFRAVRETFAGDAKALSASRAEIRKRFHENERVSDAAVITRLVAEAHDAAAFLRESIVQARLNSAGRYGACVTCARHSANPGCDVVTG